MATQSYTGADVSGYEVEGGGWIIFAVSMLGLAGVWNAIQGILAIGDSRVYVGEIHVCVQQPEHLGLDRPAAGRCAVAGGVRDRERERVRPLVRHRVAGVNAIGQLFWVPAYPFWAITIFAIDILIIYALAVYGGKKLKEA